MGACHCCYSRGTSHPIQSGMNACVVDWKMVKHVLGLGVTTSSVHAWWGAWENGCACTKNAALSMLVKAHMPYQHATSNSRPDCTGGHHQTLRISRQNRQCGVPHMTEMYEAETYAGSLLSPSGRCRQVDWRRCGHMVQQACSVHP
jgi:hypothetical protein